MSTHTVNKISATWEKTLLIITCKGTVSKNQEKIIDFAINTINQNHTKLISKASEENFLRGGQR